MNKYKILYVDDEESNLRIFKDTFRRKFDVYTATSAKEGINLLEEVEIDLILSDQRMPEMTGVEFLQYTFDKYPGTNRILVTGYSDIDAVENAINKARVFQYIQKPWEEDSLLSIIDDALRIQQLEKENARQKEELRLAWMKAEESDKLKSEFINNISHEIRTPLNGINGFSELLYSQELGEEQKKEYLEIIQNCSFQLTHTIDSILELSNLITKQQHPVIEEIDLNIFIDELYSLYSKSKAVEKDIKFEVRKGLCDGNCTFYSDKKQLYTILCKILDNAFKFTEKGKIILDYTLDQDRLIITVKDSGIGISEDSQQIIFNRFAKENSTLSKFYSGLGLGLSIALESAKLINASLSLESEKGKGTSIFISVPFKQVQSSINSNLEAEQLKLSDNFKLLKILIAEDEDVNYIYLEMLIHKVLGADAKIIRAQNGLAAIDAVKNNPDINMVLMDIKMPLIDGYDATKNIKGLKPQIPIIAQTAYSTDDDRQKAMNAGCDGFISKPIQKQELETILIRYSKELGVN